MAPIDGSDQSTLPASEARRLGREARSQLDDVQRAGASAGLTERLLALAEFDGTANVAGYWPVGSEADLREAWRQLHARGTAVHLPVVDPTGAPEMTFAPWSPGAAMQPNRFTIPEPLGVGVPVEQLAVVVVPCVAVDRHGTRVGMGAGFYDRALRRRSAADVALTRSARPILVGAAFECQVLPRIDARHWDVPMDIVVTESRVARPGDQN